MCEDYPEESRSLDEVRRDLRVLEAAGVKTLRVSIGWDGVEPERDRYDFAFWDDFMELVASESHITVLPYVAYTPRWNSEGSPEDFWKTPPRETEEFAEIMGLLAARYERHVSSWEIWNEPDNRDYWLGSAADYVELLEAGANAVRTADAEARVVFGGLAGGVEFLREAFDQHGAARHVDVVNLHSYYETWNPNPLETLPSYVEEVEAIVKRHGGNEALWMAEVGYSNFRAPNAAAPLYAYEHTADFQAVMLVRTHALMLSIPALSLVAWYELKDVRASDAVIGDAHNRHLGVVAADYAPKPALEALSFTSSLFAAGFRSADAELTVTPPPTSNLRWRSFVTGRGTLILIAWLATHPEPSQRSGSSNGADTRRETVRVEVPYAARGPAALYDARGRVQSEVEPMAEGNGFRLELEVRGGEVQIVEVPLRS